MFNRSVLAFAIASVSAILPGDWAASVPERSYVDAIVSSLANAARYYGDTVVHLPNRVRGYDILASIYVHSDEGWPIHAALLVVPTSDIGCQTIWHKAQKRGSFFYPGLTSYDAKRMSTQSEQGHAQFTFKCKVDFQALQNATPGWVWGGQNALAQAINQWDQGREPWQAQCPCQEDTVLIQNGKATCVNSNGRTAKDCLKTNNRVGSGSPYAVYVVKTDYKNAASSRRSLAPANDVVTVCMEATFGAVHQFNSHS